MKRRRTGKEHGMQDGTEEDELIKEKILPVAVRKMAATASRRAWGVLG
jgi:hypothetical protein